MNDLYIQWRKFYQATGFALASLVLNVRPVSAQSLEEGAEAARPEGVPDSLFGPGGLFESIANTLLFLIGAVAVIMLIIGGFRFVVSGGDSSSVEGARNTILYAIVGIVVAFLAYAAVNFIIGRLGA